MTAGDPGRALVVAASGTDLAIGGWRVAMALVGHGHRHVVTSPATLADALGMDVDNVDLHLADLERRGLVQVHRGDGPYLVVDIHPRADGAEMSGLRLVG